MNLDTNLDVITAEEAARQARKAYERAFYGSDRPISADAPSYSNRPVSADAPSYQEYWERVDALKREADKAHRHSDRVRRDRGAELGFPHYRFSRNVEALRTRRGISKKDLAAACGFSVSKLAAIERGGAGVKLELWEPVWLAEAFGVGVGDLYEKRYWND